MLLNSPIFSFNFGWLSFYWITASFRTSRCKKLNPFKFIQELSLPLKHYRSKDAETANMDVLLSFYCYLLIVIRIIVAGQIGITPRKDAENFCS